MKFEPNREQRIAAEEFLQAQTTLYRAEDTLNRAYSPVREFIEQGQFANAREYLRSMPNCATKTLYFREIILAE